MAVLKNLYDINDSYFPFYKYFKIQDEDWIELTYDNSESDDTTYLNLFNKISLNLNPNEKYYAYIEIKNVSGTGGFFITDQVTEKEKLSDLQPGQILKYNLTTLKDFSNSLIMLKTYFKFLPGESGSMKFRISILNKDLEIEDFEYMPYFEDEEYEFYIDDNKYFCIPSLNLKYLFSPRESEVPDMPNASESTVKIAGKDGDIVLNTTYDPLTFKLVVYTDDGLSPMEKVKEINKINSFLHSIKKRTKKFAIGEKRKMYSVKYYDRLITTEYPMFVKFEIPLKSSNPYGTDLLKKKILGAGIKTSDTIEPTGCIIKINGPAQNPTIALNDYQMYYDNVIIEGNQLIINTKNSTVTLITSTGIQTNASIYYNHQYPKIVPGNNEIKILSGISDPTQVSTEWYDLKI